MLFIGEALGNMGRGKGQRGQQTSSDARMLHPVHIFPDVLRLVSGYNLFEKRSVCVCVCEGGGGEINFGEWEKH